MARSNFVMYLNVLWMVEYETFLYLWVKNDWIDSILNLYVFINLDYIKYLGSESAKRNLFSDTLLTLQMVTAGNGLLFNRDRGESSDVKTDEFSYLSQILQQKKEVKRIPHKQTKIHMILLQGKLESITRIDWRRPITYVCASPPPMSYKSKKKH